MKEIKIVAGYIFKEIVFYFTNKELFSYLFFPYTKFMEKFISESLPADIYNTDNPPFLIF